MAVSGAGSRAARTHFTVLELLALESYLEARLETGRTHQIRAHFAAIGHPLTGDTTYGGARRYDLRAPVPARPPARLRASAQRRAAQLRVAAPGRPRGGAGGRAGRAALRFAGSLQSAVLNQPPFFEQTGILPGARRQVPASGAGRIANRPRRFNARGRPHRAAPGRSALRPSDAPLEPEHAPLHLRRAGRDPHHRPAADRGAAGERPPLRRRARQRRRHRALRRHQEAGPRHGPGMGRSLQDALRQQALAGWPADQLQHDVDPDRPPARAQRLERGRQTRSAADQGADGHGGRTRQARVQPRRRPRHGPPARRGLRHRSQNRGDRGPRGGAPADPDHRPGRHQLRPDPGRLRDPRQRRRDPLLPASDRHDRRRRRGGLQRLAGAGGEAHRRGNGAAQKGRGRAQEARGGRESPARGGGRRESGRRRRGAGESDRAGSGRRRRDPVPARAETGDSGRGTAETRSAGGQTGSAAAETGSRGGETRRSAAETARRVGQTGRRSG